jgi:hypothetical protein
MKERISGRSRIWKGSLDGKWGRGRSRDLRPWRISVNRPRAVIHAVVTGILYRSATRDARSHMMHAFSKIQPPYSNMDDIPHNNRIELAITDLESQECLNYAAAARKWNIERTTLSRRHKGVISSKVDQYSYTVKTLTNV